MRVVIVVAIGVSTCMVVSDIERFNALKINAKINLVSKYNLVNRSVNLKAL